MNKYKIIALLATLFVTLPIWFYLTYWMLKAMDAGDLQMFLFWVYLPFTILVTIFIKIGEDE